MLVGRFQVAYLHNGHMKLLENTLNVHARVLILLGVAVTLGTKKNPLDFTSRLGLFTELQEKRNYVFGKARFILTRSLI